jgi:GNAT superfamily N-acetyltransferase
LRIEPINRADWPVLIAMGENAFKVSKFIMENLIAPVDLFYSRKITQDENIIGYYLLRPRCVLDGWAPRMSLREDLSGYRAKNGVEGVALVVDPAYRGHGHGKLLMDLPREYGFQYCWGYQQKNLDNIHHWMKRRRLVARLGQLYVTLQDLS